MIFLIVLVILLIGVGVVFLVRKHRNKVVMLPSKADTEVRYTKAAGEFSYFIIYLNGSREHLKVWCCYFSFSGSSFLLIM